MKRTLYILLLSLLVTGCNPKPYMMPAWKQDFATKGPGSASVEFNQGWRDGCESGSATSATHLQRLFHGFKMKEQLVENDDYYNGWNKAFRYCHRYLYQYHRKVFSN